MNKFQIVGIVLLILGCSSYFFVEGEPYSTIAGFVAGAGFSLILIGFGLAAKGRQPK